MRSRVAVLMGGRSSEHDVSLLSARSVVAALDRERYDVTTVLIERDGTWRVDGAPVVLGPAGAGHAVLVGIGGGEARELDCVFPVLHGPFGEDGTVQGLLEMAGVPYVGAGVTASALAMDKALFKALMRDAGVPVPEGIVVEAHRWRERPDEVREEVAALVGYPAFCKPARLGSSVGISPVPAPASLDAALDLALVHDAKALVERAIRGREVEVGLLGDRDPVVSPPGEIVYASEWYDYETKYLPGRMELRVPAAVSTEVAARLQALARRAYEVVGCAGMARIDFFVTPDDEVLVSELNTIPGFTPTSVYARLMEAGGTEYAELIGRLVDLAGARALEAAGYRL